MSFQPKGKKTFTSQTLTPQQIYNLSRGIGCENCGNPEEREVCGYKCCKRKACERELTSIHKANQRAKKRPELSINV